MHDDDISHTDNYDDCWCHNIDHHNSGFVEHQPYHDVVDLTADQYALDDLRRDFIDTLAAIYHRVDFLADGDADDPVQTAAAALVAAKRANSAGDG